MIRKESEAGVGYSVVELGGVRHVFVAAVARQAQTYVSRPKTPCGRWKR